MKNVLKFLENSANQFPNKEAVVDGEKIIDYTGLVEKSKKYGSYIARLCESRQPVVVFSFKSIQTLSAMFGAAYAGCFYVPVNPEQPNERVEKILEVLKAPLVITTDELKERIEEIGYKGAIATYTKLEQASLDNELILKRQQSLKDEDPLYGIFTSGSTGTPKCIIVNHQCVVDFIGHFTQTFGLKQSDRIGNQAPFDFDVSVKDIYSAIKLGATLVLIQKELFALPPGLLDYLEDKQVTVLVWAVSALCQISGLHGFDYKVPANIHTVMFSGEKMPIKQLTIWQEAMPDTRFINLYGPTEITCNCTYFPVDRIYNKEEKLPIGNAFEGRNVFLLDENRKIITEADVTGEICCSGESIALGYYKNEEQTNKAFIMYEYKGENLRTYCTGDLAYYDEKGRLVFAGRKDFQIKHMGHRIELEEIENNMNNLEEVTRSVVLIETNKNKITAFYCGSVAPKELRAILKEKLPVYMVPQKINQVDAIPLTKNGKLDRKYFKELLEV